MGSVVSVMKVVKVANKNLKVLTNTVTLYSRKNTYKKKVFGHYLIC